MATLRRRVSATASLHPLTRNRQSLFGPSGGLVAAKPTRAINQHFTASNNKVIAVPNVFRQPTIPTRRWEASRAQWVRGYGTIMGYVDSCNVDIRPS